MKMISIVIPAYNEEESLPYIINSLISILQPKDYMFEIIIVDDGSQDKTFEVIKEYNQKFYFVKGIKLSRNMGHQAALDCGLHHSSGDVIISMDADMQHPPELILEMLDLWEHKGYEIVLTSKMENEESGKIYKIWARFFYFIFNKFSQIKLTPNGSDFRLMGRKSLDAILRMPEYHKFYRGMVHFVGFNTITIQFKVNKRIAGKRGYSFMKSVKLAFDGLSSFSNFALKIPLLLGVISLIIVIGYIIYNVIGLFFFNFQFEKGWTSLISILIISLGLQLFFLGTIGVYIGNIYNEVKRRPLYFTDEKVGELKSNNLNNTTNN
jgi:polyisoprenyl-phosphate glycosyltransferase